MKVMAHLTLALLPQVYELCSSPSQHLRLKELLGQPNIVQLCFDLHPDSKKWKNIWTACVFLIPLQCAGKPTIYIYVWGGPRLPSVVCDRRRMGLPFATGLPQVAVLLFVGRLKNNQFSLLKLES
ncbi:uncharacterized protein LOC110896176 isoform X3 [Helianthus annuus]|uniref:uncharacterized protein LOC110896176 isoform X3 n=1 Tax=Helianthus annuus TaxID=4232 RepID=UPI000B902A84|nr:uncharacterized protein LOC110896176 isoform X3 [Helianthus annuus]